MDYITYRLHVIIWLKFQVFHKRFYKNTELWLKLLLLHKGLHNNTEFS